MILIDRFYIGNQLFHQEAIFPHAPFLLNAARDVNAVWAEQGDGFSHITRIDPSS